MISYTWSILEVYGDENITKVRYLLKAQDEQNIIETEGYHQFSEGVVYKPISEIKEENLIDWLDQDTVTDEINIIKLNLESQLQALKTTKKVEFPWEANTFTIG
jgi:hypothetical protein